VVGTVDPGDELGEVVGAVVVGGAVVVVVVVDAGVGAAGTTAGALLDPLAPDALLPPPRRWRWWPRGRQDGGTGQKPQVEWARCLVSGECDRRGDFIGDLGSASIHGSSRGLAPAWDPSVEHL